MRCARLAAAGSPATHRLSSGGGPMADIRKLWIGQMPAFCGPPGVSTVMIPLSSASKSFAACHRGPTLNHVALLPGFTWILAPGHAIVVDRLPARVSEPMTLIATSGLRRIWRQRSSRSRPMQPFRSNRTGLAGVLRSNRRAANPSDRAGPVWSEWSSLHQHDERREALAHVRVPARPATCAPAGATIIEPPPRLAHQRLLVLLSGFVSGLLIGGALGYTIGAGRWM
jgi:hypothetical protein